MKKLIFVFAFFLGVIGFMNEADAQQYVYLQGAPNINRVVMTNNVGYAATDIGLFKSVDGGFTWDNIFPVPFLSEVTDVVVNGNHLYVLRNDYPSAVVSSLLFSSNGGQTWSVIDNQNAYGNKIMIDGGIVFVGYNTPEHFPFLRKYDDIGGETIFTGQYVDHIVGINKDISGNVVVGTTQRVYIVMQEDVYEMIPNVIIGAGSYFHNDNIYIVGEVLTGIPAISHWRKNEWVVQSFPLQQSGTFNQLLFSDEAGYAVGGDQMTGFVYTGQENQWTRILEVPEALNSVAVDPMTSNRIYAGKNGLVVIDNTTSIDPLSVVTGSYKLSQNYPNPFNPETKINFSIPNAGNVNLSVYDMTGREVANLVDEKLQAGSYEYAFNASHLTSGVYFYTLQTGNFRETKKMMLIK